VLKAVEEDLVAEVVPAPAEQLRQAPQVPRRLEQIRDALAALQTTLRDRGVEAPLRHQGG